MIKTEEKVNQLSFTILISKKVQYLCGGIALLGMSGMGLSSQDEGHASVR